MAEVKNSFVGGRMEKDLDERLIPDGVYRDALNIDVDTDSGSNVGSARNSLGNTLVGDYTTARGMSSYDPSTDNATTIGAVKYEADNLLYWFVAADTFDGIFEYDEVNDIVTRVLVCTKATPTTESTLRFARRYLITGVNYIDGYLYWTDNYNPPRRVNIARAKGYAIDDARIADDIDVIVKPPLDSPRILVTNDAGIQSNNIEEKFLYFSVRYKNIDDQYSAMSPFSAVAFHAGDFELDPVSGSNKAMTNDFNSCVVSFNTGDQFVKEVQLLMRDARSNNIYVVESFNKEKLGLSNNITYPFTFNNNKTYGVLDSAQLGRLFDNVPLKAKSQEFVGNRLMYGNYVQFYDMNDCNGEEINVDLDVNYESTTDILNGTPRRTWRSDRDYEVGIEYLDEYGRSTTVFTSENNTTYIPATKSDRANSLVVNISNPPPCWATKYRLLVKSSKKEYYNIFPIRIYSDTYYRWLQINPSDRDKVKEGGYVIVKSLASGPTYSNKRYKVLEIAQKNVDGWLNGNGYAGLYFKIKVDDLNEVNVYGQYWNWTVGIGSSTYDPSFVNGIYPVDPIDSNDPSNSYTETPIHYGNGDPNGIVLTNNTFIPDPTPTNLYKDERITIQIDTPTTYSVLKVIIGSSIPQYPVPGAIGLPIVQGASIQTSFFSATFSQSAYTPGDKWVFNCKYEDIPSIFKTQGVAIVPGEGWSPTSPETDRAIEANARIRLQVFEDIANPSYGTSSNGPVQEFVSPRRFDNIEEWWYESGARDQFIYLDLQGNNIKGTQVIFRRGENWSLVNGVNTSFPTNQIDVGITPEARNYPVRMLVCSSVPPNPGQGPGNTGSAAAGLYNQQTGPTSKFTFNFEILQQEEPNVVETVPDDNNLEVYHETTQTYDITGGVHMAITTDSPNNVNQTVNGSFYTNAVIKLNYPGNENSDFNAWTFGNGLESDRIRDDWNSTTLEYSPRVNSYVEDYSQRRSESAICYSGIYGENTGVDKLNEFNLSIANFKYLDKEFGSIQKLHAEDTNLLVLQENKVSRVLYGKNLLSDSVGGGSVVSIPEVLGSQIPYPGEWGISGNPESFAVWGGIKWFTDQRRGAVLQMSGDAEPIPISDAGMRDHFRDLMRDQPYEQKLGAYDPDKNMYTLAYNNNSVQECELTINKNQLKIGSPIANNLYLFTINTSTSWTVTLLNTGFGTSWITALGTNSGYGIGNQDIYCSVAANGTGAIRNVKFVVTYCDGLAKEFTLIQGRSKKGKITLMVINNDKF